MSDFQLLTSLWLIPLAGSIGVLFAPKKSEHLVKWIALAICTVTFLISLLAFGAYTAPGDSSPMASTLRDRAENNLILTKLEGNGIVSSPKDLDVDGDGMINKLEITRCGMTPEVFDKVDKDKDGKLSSAEYAGLGVGDLVVREPWIPYFNIQYYLGLDGISLSLVLLTGLTSLLACGASWKIEKQVKGYYSLFLLLLASMMGVFMALDMFLFYIFFEVMLLPMYFLIAIWGGPNREYAAIKFLLFTLFGSVFILVGILILYYYGGDAEAMLGGNPFKAHSFDSIWVARAASETTYYGSYIQKWVFSLMLIGFIVKLPSFPFHTWLPDAHVEAPTPISMILAGVLLKIGGYGLIRLAWPLAPVGAYELATPVAAIGVFSIIYGALVAMAQTDFKKLVAYSSVSHMGYVTLGMAAVSLTADPKYYSYGVNGAMFMMIAHGITSAGMFFMVGVIYDRLHTRDLNKLGGLFQPMPLYGFASFIIFFGSMGLPGLCGFIAEVFVILGAFNFNYKLAILAATAVILTAGYILWTLQRVFLGPNQEHKHQPDLDMREWSISVPLIVLTVVLGVAPQWSLLNWMGPSVDNVVQAITSAKGMPSPTAKPADEKKIARPNTNSSVDPALSMINR